MFGWMIQGVILVLPTGTLLPSGFTDMVSIVVDYAYGFDWLVPIGTIFSVISATLIFFTAEMLWRASRWFVQYIRGN